MIRGWGGFQIMMMLSINWKRKTETDRQADSDLQDWIAHLNSVLLAIKHCPAMYNRHCTLYSRQRKGSMPSMRLAERWGWQEAPSRSKVCSVTMGPPACQDPSWHSDFSKGHIQHVYKTWHTSFPYVSIISRAIERMVANQLTIQMSIWRDHVKASANCHSALLVQL